MELQERSQASKRHTRQISALDTNLEPYDKISMLNTLKNVFMLRKPGYIPSPAALKDFQDEMKRRLKLKSGEGDGTGRTENRYRMISIHPSCIPEDISFDRMMAGATFPPINMAGFKAFLTNIDYNVENMDFLLYVQHYAKLFQAVAEDERSALSPEWTRRDEELAKRAIININSTDKESHVATVSVPQAQLSLPTPPSSSDGETSMPETESKEQHSTPPATSEEDKHLSIGKSFRSFSPPATSEETKHLSIGKSFRSFSDADIDAIAPFAKVESNVMPVIDDTDPDAEPIGAELPVSVMNLWKESERIAKAFILTDGPKQLNLSSRERELVLYAIANNNHPSSFAVALRAADNVLRNDSYPKFLQLATPNMNRIRQKFAYCMGYVCITLGLVYAASMCLTSARREWRLFAVPLIVIGVATLSAARHGMCLVLHSFGHYQVKPWEVYDPEQAERAHANPEVFLGGKYNGESKDWVQRYNRRYAMRKIFDKEAPVEDPRIRDAQNIIFGQGLFIGFMASLIAMGIFVSLPPTNFI
ncbi:uncharacterized protein RSE6_12011 [Rhynchosporium secalis]|uniref:RGS domain-containing protein n=1 Tax=Rhynchosporium secalis TaxID=38038 RepID=A0A1E1MPB1_RHYSE|nr:uncharacterized protein RSE6_12011 [Rhynchosporium secalis]